MDDHTRFIFINDFYSQVSSAPRHFSRDVSASYFFPVSGEIPLEWSTVNIIGVEISTLGVQNNQFLIANNRESASIANFQPI